jgi:hypothetical protein
MLKGRRSLVAGRRNAGLGVVEATLPAGCWLPPIACWPAPAGLARAKLAAPPGLKPTGRLPTSPPGDHGPCVAGRRDRGDGTGGRAGATSTAAEETAVVA